MVLEVFINVLSGGSVGNGIKNETDSVWRHALVLRVQLGGNCNDIKISNLILQFPFSTCTEERMS